MRKKPSTKTTRAAAALNNMLAGRQQRKISGQVSGRAAEQWATLIDKASPLGFSADDVLALLLHIGYTALADELDARSETGSPIR